MEISKNSSGGRTIEIDIQLRVGSTVIFTRQFFDISDTVVQDDYTLSGTEADNISDYSNLNFRVWAVRSGSGGARRGGTTWVELETPDAPAGAARTVWHSMVHGQI